MMSIATEIKHARLRQKQRAFLSPWSDLNGVTMNDCRPGLSGTHLNIGIGRREEGTPLKRPSQYFHSEKRKERKKKPFGLLCSLLYSVLNVLWCVMRINLVQTKRKKNQAACSLAPNLFLYCMSNDLFLAFKKGTHRGTRCQIKELKDA